MCDFIDHAAFLLNRFAAWYDVKTRYERRKEHKHWESNFAKLCYVNGSYRDKFFGNHLLCGKIVFIWEAKARLAK